MKKLLALALALMLALSCTAAFAEEAAPAYGINTKVQLSLNHSLAPMLVGATTGNYDEALSEAVMDVLDNIYLDVACGGGVVDMALMTGDYPLTSLVAVGDEEGFTCVGDLFPHYALRMDKADLEAMMDSLMQQMESQVNVQMGGVSLSEEEQQALLEDAQGYIEDIAAFFENLHNSAQVSEDGATVVMPITTHQLADLAETLLNRLSADEVVKPYLQMAVDQANAQAAEDQKITLEQALAEAKEQIQQLKDAEDTTLAAVTASQQEDGSTYIELNALNQLLVSISVLENGMDLTALISQTGITDAQAQLKGIQDGTNAEDGALMFNLRKDTDDEGVTETSMVWDVMFGGLDVVLNVSNAQAGLGTIDYVSHSVGTFSINLLGGDLLQVEVVSMADELPAAPELGDRTVLNLTKLTEEEQQALINDVTTYGLPALAAACVQGMPDQVAALVELGLKAKDLSFQPGSKTEETYDYSEDYSYEEEEIPDDGIDLTGTWTAKDGSVLVLNADGTFSLTYLGKETQGTWEKPFNGSVSLDTEQVGMYWDYTETTITGTIGFDWVEFTR